MAPSALFPAALPAAPAALLPTTLLHLGGMALCIGLTVALQRGLVALAHCGLEAAQPLAGETEEQTVRYSRGLATPGPSDLRWLRSALVLSGLALWVGWAGHALWWALAGAVGLLACVAWDLWTWQRVVATPWQVHWRRGWREPVRQLPLAQVAALHVVERPASGRMAQWAARVGLRWGTAYLALEFHSGRAAKLPRTDLVFGLPRVRRLAQFITQRQDQAVRARRHAILSELRARRQAPRLLPDPEELALRRELALLRAEPAVRQALAQRGLTLTRFPLLGDSSAG